MKNLRLFITSCVIMVSMFAWSYDFEVDGIYYNKIDDKSVSVTNGGEDSDKYKYDVIIPSTVTYNDTLYSVTSISAWAFNNCSGLTSVTIPSGVTSIGYDAFNN